MRAILLAAVLATPVSAQSLDPRYEAVGTFEGTFGTTPVSMMSLNDLEKDRNMIKRRSTGGFTTYNISARTIGSDGLPAGPSVSFTIGPLGAGGGDARSDVFFSDETGYYVADVDNGNRASLSEFAQDENSVTFSVNAELAPVKRGGDGFEIDTSRTGQTITGRFSGTVAGVK